MFFDPLYLIMMVPMIALSGVASLMVKSAFSRYSKIGTRSGFSGADIAREILRLNGLNHVSVTEARGFLSDHYDPMKRVVRLSPEVYRSSSVAALGVAAHETGHAIQHARGYAPLMIRNLLVPMASIGSNLSWIIIMIGFVVQAMGMVKIGILLFTVVVLFQVLTLPVEFDASSRAKQILATQGFVNGAELAGVRKVLNAAAMTYVAAAMSAIMTLVYFLLRAGLLGGNDD